LQIDIFDRGVFYMTANSIFLAEGEKHVRKALHLMLEHQGNFVIVGEADHAESLLAQVCQQPPDVILLDLNLPGLHPQRLLTTLHQYCPVTRILASSVRPEQEKTARELGVDAFLLKQLPPDQFFQVLVSALDEPSLSETT
jgi:DNA-binding NarL/FixJ family response regulator